MMRVAATHNYPKETNMARTDQMPYPWHLPRRRGESMSAIYNEIDPYPSQWLRNLIAAGHIAPGEVLERSISELEPEDLRGATQSHFFAGIGVWSAALRDAGWPDERPVWTGSCPCQPFSDAGRGLGTSDVRHLWPEWFRLIRECRPPVLLGEQVASRAGLGWLDTVFADLEGEGYACAAADLPAAGVGAPHKRSRLFFVAHADGEQRRLHEARREPGRDDAQAQRRGETQRMADRDSAGLEVICEQQARQQREAAERGCEVGGLAVRSGDGRHERHALGFGSGDRKVAHDGRDRSADDSEARELVDSSRARSWRNTGAVLGTEAQGATEWGNARRLVDVSRSAGATRGYWSDADWLLCRDGKARPVKSGSFTLVDGSRRGVVRNRAAKLKGYGNAIVRQVAAAFIRAAIGAMS